MKNGKKCFFSWSVWLFIFGVICAIIGYLFYAKLPDIASKELSKKLKVPVTIADIFLSWDRIHISDVEIANLPHLKLSKAFSAETIHVEAPITTYTKKEIEIEKIVIDNIYLGLEFNSASSTEGNWTILMNNIQSQINVKTDGDSEEKTSVFIKELVLTNIYVEVYYDKEKGSVKKFPVIEKIVLTNISSTDGVPGDQILSSVLGQMLKSVFIKENLQNMLKGFLEAPGNGVNSLLSPFKRLIPGL